MQLTDSLTQAEAAVQALTAALAGSDANTLEACSTELRDAFMSLAVLSQQHSRSGQTLEACLQQRINAVGSQIGPLREQLVRASAFSGQKISSLMPLQSAAPTYEALAGRPMRSQLSSIYRSQG